MFNSADKDAAWKFIETDLPESLDKWFEGWYVASRIAIVWAQNKHGKYNSDNIKRTIISLPVDKMGNLDCVKIESIIKRRTLFKLQLLSKEINERVEKLVK